VTPITVARRPSRQSGVMPEIVLPNTWRDRVDSVLGRRRDLLLLLAVVGVSAIAALLLWGRGAPARIAPPARSMAAVGDSASPVTGAVPTPATGQPILVHVAGAVRRPGLYEFQPGARVADAIDAARGPRSPATLNQLNLAEPLVDGQKIQVLGRGAAVPPTAGGTSGSTVSGSPPAGGAPLVSLNSADQVALETIPGVGPVTATAILDFRAQVGGFSSIDQLLDVSGIGPATLESIRPYVTL